MIVAYELLKEGGTSCKHNIDVLSMSMWREKRVEVTEHQTGFRRQRSSGGINALPSIRERCFLPVPQGNMQLLCSSNIFTGDVLTRFFFFPACCLLLNWVRESSRSESKPSGCAKTTGAKMLKHFGGDRAAGKWLSSRRGTQGRFYS